MDATNASTISVTSCDNRLSLLLSLSGREHPNFRAIAKMPEFQGIPAGTLSSIAKTGKIPRKYRRMFVKPKPRVKHICQNCQVWTWTDEDAEGQKYGPCDSEQAPYSANQVDGRFHPYADFGCIFWTRKAGL